MGSECATDKSRHNTQSIHVCRKCNKGTHKSDTRKVSSRHPHHEHEKTPFRPAQNPLALSTQIPAELTHTIKNDSDQPHKYEWPDGGVARHSSPTASSNSRLPFHDAAGTTPNIHSQVPEKATEGIEVNTASVPRTHSRFIQQTAS